METLVLLVTLAILWAGAGVYWLRTRVPTPGLALPQVGGRRSALPVAFGRSPSSTVIPIRSAAVSHRDIGRPESAPSSAPGHSLVQPARARTPQPQSVSSEQARLRRRNVLLVLAGAALVTLIGAFTVGGSLIIVHLFVDALLLAFVLSLVQYQREIDIARTEQLPVYARPQQGFGLAATGTDGRHSR